MSSFTILMIEMLFFFFVLVFEYFPSYTRVFDQFLIKLRGFS